MALFNKIFSFIKTVINSVLDLSLEKAKIIFTLNKGFTNEYLSGAAKRLVICSITMGDMSFKHAMSDSFIRSGFMLKIQNDEDLTLAEANEISLYILDNEMFLRKLMMLGFDTLIVKGKTTQSINFKMSNYFAIEKRILQ